MPEINYWRWFHINGISLAHRGFSYTNYSLQQNTTINDVTQKLLIMYGHSREKTCFGGFDQVKLKPVGSTTETN